MKRSTVFQMIGQHLVGSLCALFAIIPQFVATGQASVPESPTFQVTVQTIHTDGKDILMSKQVPTDGQPVQQTYTISVPYTENGVTKLRTETRTRTVQPSKASLAPIDDNTTFQNLAGAELKRAALLSKIPKTGLQVVLAPPTLKEIPASWKAILKRTSSSCEYHQSSNSTAAIG